MSVELDPQELSFKRPFTREVVQKLFIKNPNHEPVAFKVKTTAPKQYCVRPNSGRIEAGKDVEVQVLLQSMREDPPPDYKCRDKFLVQSVKISADQEMNNVAQIWTDVERTDKGSIQERKIRVQYLNADESTPPNEHTDSTSPPPSYAAHGNESHHSKAPVGAVSVPESKPDNAVTSHEAAEEARSFTSRNDLSANSNVARSSTETTTTATGTSLADQLAEAKAQIVSLTAQLSDPNSELRQRNVADLAVDAKDKVVAGVTNIGRTAQAPEGVPVQIAALLCLIAFLTAYFLF